MRLTKLVFRWGAAALAALLTASAAADDFVGVHAGDTRFAVLRGGRLHMNLAIGGWGPKWSWQGWRGETKPAADGLVIDGSTPGLKAAAVYRAVDGGLSVETSLRAERDMDVTLVMLGCSFPDIGAGEWRAVNSAGASRRGRLPFARGDLDNFGPIASVEILVADGSTTRLQFDPAIPIPVENGELRLELAAGRVEAGRTYGFRLRAQLPGTIKVYADPAAVPDPDDFGRWFAFRGTGHPEGKSLFDMDGWDDAPAGAHGRVTLAEDRLLYGGRPIKLWGLNLCYADCAPQRELADQRAALYRRYGINTVRLHKYADGSGWRGILTANNAAEYDPALLDRMDYFIARLKAAGIFVKLSPIFYVKPRSGNRAEIPYYGEFEDKDGAAQTGGGAMYLGRELQDLQIRQITNLLKHRNPHTGMTYAEDPAIAVIELTNEDSILFYGTLGVLQRSPTLRRRVGEAFTAWLKKKYGTEEHLLAAWGRDMLGNFRAEGFPEEKWADNTIYPIGNPWFYSPEQLDGSQKNRKARLLDTMAFLAEVQDATYRRMADAIRAAGYTGALVASNWQAGEGTSHYLNLRSDAAVGIVDRHNYFGGGTPQVIRNASMLADAGSGTLSTGFQQVRNRPFMISEWIHVMPNEWGVEGPALIGAYGLGLQGWDASYLFQNRDNGAFEPSLRTGHNNVWQVNTPQVLGAFPTVSRMVRRGDVREALRTHPLNVHLPSMLRGEWSFRDRTIQQHDVKSFATEVVPAEALAVSRIAVEFTEEPQPTPPFDLAAHQKDGGYVSDTGQLFWRPGDGPTSGFLVVDTPGTVALVGFAEGRTVETAAARITLRSRFAAIFLTARNAEGTLAGDREVLVSAIARARNRGARYLADKIIADFGDDRNGPVLLEPVRAAIRLQRAPATVHLLDHDGVKTGKTVPCAAGVFEIDTARDETPYYLIEYP